MLCIAFIKNFYAKLNNYLVKASFCIKKIKKYYAFLNYLSKFAV